jgi:SAM-dependent methyltransferase
MEKRPDWVGLWKELVWRRGWKHQRDECPDSDDVWRTRATEFDEHIRRRWARPDSSRTFILSMLDASPGSKVLDIGAGTGRWALLMASHAARVTAVERSASMIRVMRSNLDAERTTNVDIVQDVWPLTFIGMHDFTFCSHAMYGFYDFPIFIRSLEAVTRHMCFLLMRAPTMDSVMAEASLHVWGHPYDSANYQVAFNALLQMGIFPNVIMEDSGLWGPWVSSDLNEALYEIKRRLGLLESKEHDHDEFLMDLLMRRLTYSEGSYIWPRGMRTALIFWQVQSEAQKQLDYRASLRPDGISSPAG